MPLFSVSENQGYSKELSKELLLIQFIKKVSGNRKGKKPATQQTFLVFQDVFKTSWRRLQRNTFHFPRRLEDVFKTTSRRICNTSSWNVFKTSSRRLQGVFKTYSRHPPRRLQDAFNTSSRRVCKTSCNYVFKTSGRQKNITLKTSSVRIHQDECLVGRFPVTTVNFMVCFLIITVQKFQWSDWSNGVQLNC